MFNWYVGLGEGRFPHGAEAITIKTYEKKRASRQAERLRTPSMLSVCLCCTEQSFSIRACLCATDGLPDRLNNPVLIITASDHGSARGSLTTDY